VNLDPLLNEFLEAVNLIEAARLVAEAADIERAIASLRSVSTELNCEGAQPALMGFIVREVDGENRVERMRISRIDMGLVESLERALREARDVVGS
jgi:hypothetical protein